MMDLGSEGVYLDENRGTNPSRHLPGTKTPVQNLKKLILGSRGFGNLRSRHIETLGPLQIKGGS